MNREETWVDGKFLVRVTQEDHKSLYNPEGGDFVRVEVFELKREIKLEIKIEEKPEQTPNKEKTK